MAATMQGSMGAPKAALCTIGAMLNGGAPATMQIVGASTTIVSARPPQHHYHRLLSLQVALVLPPISSRRKSASRRPNRLALASAKPVLMAATMQGSMGAPKAALCTIGAMLNGGAPATMQIVGASTTIVSARP